MPKFWRLLLPPSGLSGISPRSSESGSALGARCKAGPSKRKGQRYDYSVSIITDCSTTSLLGLSWRLRGTLTIFSTTS